MTLFYNLVKVIPPSCIQTSCIVYRPGAWSLFVMTREWYLLVKRERGREGERGREREGGREIEVERERGRGERERERG